MSMKYNIKDISLEKKGMTRIEWAKRDMPTLTGIAFNFKKSISELVCM